MNDRLEQYLRDVARGLEGFSDRLREDEIAELRHHLETAVASRQQAGIDEAEATQEALTQFGPAHAVSRGIRRAWWRERLRVPDTVGAAAMLAIVGAGLFRGILAPLVGTLTDVLGLTRLQQTSPLVIGAWLLSVLTPYVFVGFGVGSLAPRRGMRGTFVGIGALLLYSQAVLLLPMVIVHVHPAGLPGNWIALQLSLAAAMIAAAVLGAWLGQWRVRPAIG